MGYPVAGAGQGYCGPGLGGIGTFCTSIGVILVLYILLVIVLRAGWF